MNKDGDKSPLPLRGSPLKGIKVRERGANNLLPLAKGMRKQMSDAERVLWHHLRAHRLLGYKFCRQVVIEPYIVDFVCMEAKLIVEADGGQHAEQQLYDEQRTVHLERLGYRVVRFWNHEILNELESVLAVIADELRRSPLPGPGPHAPWVANRLHPCSRLPEGEGV